LGVWSVTDMHGWRNLFQSGGEQVHVKKQQKHASCFW